MTETEKTIEVVSIKFRNRGKMYYFDPAGLTLRNGDEVIVETSKGLEMGSVVQGNHTIQADRVVQPLRPVARAATDGDKRIAELCRRREREAFVICRQKIKDHGLEMKLVDVECGFEGNKILFFFSSDGRVDFRELVKDLASVFRTRIELRQIGVRDEARMLGGLGICGRAFCCGAFIDEFQPVSTKMAKIQSMSLNPAKISGCCGRLMCCLRYEQPAYEELVKNVPKNGAFVETPDGYGNVTQVNVLRQTVKVRLDGSGDDTIRQYDAEDVAAIPGCRPRDGSQPPHVLVLRQKKPKEPEERQLNKWDMPEMLVSSPAEPEGGAEQGRRPNNRRRGKKEAQPRDGQPGGKTARAAKPRGQKQGGGPKAGQEKREPAPSKRGPQNQRQGKPQEGGEQKAKKPYYNRRRNKPRPKSGGESGAPRQGE